MALQPCRECHVRVSTEASACPRCGCPNPTAPASGPATSGGQPEKAAVAREKQTMLSLPKAASRAPNLPDGIPAVPAWLCTRPEPLGGPWWTKGRWWYCLLVGAGILGQLVGPWSKIEHGIYGLFPSTPAAGFLPLVGLASVFGYAWAEFCYRAIPAIAKCIGCRERWIMLAVAVVAIPLATFLCNSRVGR